MVVAMCYVIKGSSSFDVCVNIFKLYMFIY